MQLEEANDADVLLTEAKDLPAETWLDKGVLLDR